MVDEEADGELDVGTVFWELVLRFLGAIVRGLWSEFGGPRGEE